MSFADKLFKRLDEGRFLGFHWEFALRSLSREYGRWFLRKVVLRYPWRTLKGTFEYRQFLKRGSREGGITYLFWESEEDFLHQVTPGESVLVGLGFCQKPFECPAGRPNHSCLYLAMLDLDQGEEGPHPICRECKVAVMGKKALAAGANMHIMTSALDIAHDVMIPAIEEGRFRKVILCLCPFSVQAIPSSSDLWDQGLPHRVLFGELPRLSAVAFGRQRDQEGDDHPPAGGV